MTEKPTYEELEDRLTKAENEAKELRTLYSAATAIGSNLSLESTLESVATQITNALDSAGCAILLWLREQNKFENLIDYSKFFPGEVDKKGTIYDLKDYPAMLHVLKTGQPLLSRLDDPKADNAEVALMKEQGIFTSLAIPLKTNKQVLGFCEIYEDVKPRDFTAQEIRLVESIAYKAAIALENAHLYKDAQNEIAKRKMIEEKLQERTTDLAQANTSLKIEIADRKQVEKEKSQLQTQLQRAQKMEAIGTLAGGVAHDLNNILSGIVSYPDLLLMDMSQDNPLRKPILTIKKSGEKATSIVQDLLTMARRGVATQEVVDLNIIISEYLKSPEHQRLKSFHSGAHIKTNLETKLFNIFGSSIHMTKTVMNLVSNAAEAMPDGGEILISTENRYIDTPMGKYEKVKEGEYIVLSVHDNGMGIVQEDLDKIFEPFYTKKVMGRSGTGLGMAVVWGTIRDHNGYIDIQSIEGEGTTFTLYFPLTRKESEKEKPLLSIEDYMGNKESVLVVDDIEEQREIASVMLRKLNYSVASVESGEEAIDYLKDNSVDLLLLDMIMDPGIDGLDTYKQILERHPKQKAIVASGFSETDRVKEIQKLGAKKYIKKPYMLENIGMAIKEELGK